MKCIIIEDEIPGQKVMKHLIDKIGTIDCLGIYESGPQVPMDVLSSADFLILDIELPDINGLDFLETLPSFPPVIVTTAYPDYAVRAFDVRVIDYLVKPISYPRFLKAIHRVQESTANQQAEISVYSDKTTYRLRVFDILYIKSELDYVSIVTEDRKYLVLDSLQNWNKKLEAHHFIFSHRSYLVHVDRVDRFTASTIGIGNHEIPISRGYRKEVERVLK